MLDDAAPARRGHAAAPAASGAGLPRLPRGELKRVARQLNLLSAGQQERLHAARVLVIGAGGLGCPLLQSLAAAGVGRIRLLDDDTVDVTNIHRQILFGAGDVGRAKVDVAAERLAALQPGIQVDTARMRLTPDNALAECAGVDLVVDGSDTFATKYLSADACEATGTPLVWGTVLRFSGQVALWHSGPGAGGDQADGRGVGLRDLFPVQPGADSAPDCATAGVLGVTTAVVGNLMATEAVKYLAGLGGSVPGRVLSYDALGAGLTAVTVRADPQRRPVTDVAEFYGAACATPTAPGAKGADGEDRKDGDAVSPAQVAFELLDKVRAGEAVALDIREPHEVLLADLPVDSVKLPLSRLRALEEAAESPEAGARSVAAAVREAVGDTRQAVVYCAAGRRSAAFVADHDVAGLALSSLPGGVAAHGG